MCTLSWTQNPHGYTVHFNRDEQRTRAPGTPPAVHRDQGMAWLAPTDAAGGGTWIGVNASGLTLALLNRYPETPREPPVRAISRGVLVRRLLHLTDPALVLTTISHAPLEPYLPFTIALFAPAVPPTITHWNGSTIQAHPVTQTGFVCTSSGVDQPGAEQTRAALFARINPTPANLADLHRAHLPVKGPLSICMHRDDAVTVSYSEITVDLAQVQLGYADGPPCRTPVAHHITLPRTLGTR